MTCSAASTLQPQATPSLLPVQLPTSQGAWQRVRTAFQQLLQMVQGAAGATGVNVVPQQYALVAGATLPPIASLSNCAVAIDTGTVLFGSGSYKISITGSPATIEFSADTAWPLSAGWQWIVSFFQQASAAFAGAITITTPKGTYTTDFTTTLTAEGFERLFDTLNLGADTSTSFGLSFTFTGGTGQTVWLDGLMMEPYFNVAMQPSPFISTSGALTVDNQPDGFTFVRLLGSHAAGNVAYNFRGVWTSGGSYVTADEVVYGPAYWVALAPSTNSAPSPSNANWQVVGSYSAFEGAWSNATAYPVGAEVTYGGNFWVCVTANTNSAPSVSNANWQIAGPTSLDDVADGATYARTLGGYLQSGRPYTYQGAYAGATAYHPGDEVSSGGNYYLCTAATTGHAPPNATYWQLLGPTTVDAVPDGATYVRLLGTNASGNVAYNYKGIWSSATAYVIGDEVVYGSTYWLAIAASTNSAPSGTNANWQAVGTYGAFEGAWSAATAYTPGAEVTYGGNFWICVAANTNSAPTTSNANWQIAGPVSLDDVADGSAYVRLLASNASGNVAYNYKGVWSSATAYVIGDEVLYGASYWLAIAASTNSAPSTSNASWQVVGSYSGFLGAWSSLTTYAIGGEVTYGGNFWIAVAQNSNSAPSTSNANWQIAGPVSLDSIADGSTYSRTLAAWVANGVPYNFQGAYSGATAYVKGAEVSSGGNYWLAIANTTGNAPPNAAYWQLLGPTSLDDVADGATYSRVLAAYVSVGVPYNYQGAWSAATAYAKGAEVSSGGNYYLAIAASTNQAPPNATYWQLLGPTTLDDVANGATYARTLAAYVAAGVPYTFSGAWSSATAYGIGVEVTYAGNYWVSVAANTNSAPSTSNANWQLLGPTSLDDLPDGSSRAALGSSGVTGGQVNTSGIVSNAITGYAITEDPNGSTLSSFNANGTYQETLESVANTTAGGWVEVTAAYYATIQPPNGAGVTMSVAFTLYRDGAQVGSASFSMSGGQASDSTNFVYLSLVDTPAAGSHTYTAHATVTITNYTSGAGVLKWGTAVIKMREFKR